MPSATKVLFVISNLSPGGAENQLVQLICAKPRSADDLEVEVLTVGHPSAKEQVYRSRLKEQDVKVTTVDRQRHAFPAFLFRLRQAIRQARPDVVHTFLPGTPGTWGRLAALLAGVPVIIHADRTLYPQGLRRVNHVMRPFLDSRTTHFMPNADAIAQSLAHKGVPLKKVTVMPNGVDTHRFAPGTVASLRCAWDIPKDAVVAGFLARFAPVKRLDLLLDAVQALEESKRPDYLVLGGDGLTMPMVKARVAADGWLREHCRILGMVESPPEFLASIDYLVLPSDSEGQPNVLLEAMASGKTVIASRVADVPVLVEGVGFLMEPGSKESLVQALETVQGLTPKARHALGQKARRKAVEQYDIRRVAERYWRAHLELAYG